MIFSNLELVKIIEKNLNIKLKLKYVKDRPGHDKEYCMETDINYETIEFEEGIKKTHTIVVENGELKTFLHNTYTSNKLKSRNTANARRYSFVNPIKVGPANFYLKPSEKSLQDLFDSIDGFYITEIMGMHMANPVSGDFSLGVNGFLIESGQKTHYIKASTFSDNFYNILNKTMAVANDLYFTGSVGSPSVWVADCVIGGEN